MAGHRRISKIPLAHLIQPLLYFAKKNSVWCLCSLFNTESFSLCTYGGTTFWIKIVCLTICLEEVDGTSSLLATISECIFSGEKCSSTTALILLQHGVSINFFSWTYFFSFLFFFRLFFTHQLDSSLFWPLNLLTTILFLSFWLFLVLFWMLWMLVMVNKLMHMTYHRPHASRITT